MKTARILLLLAIMMLIVMIAKAQKGTIKGSSGSIATKFEIVPYKGKFTCFEVSPYTPDSVKITLQECIKFLLPNECSFWGKFERYPTNMYEKSVDVHISWKKESYDCTVDEFVEMIYRK